MARTRWRETAPAFLIGIGIGVAMGILLAPKSGKDTRDQIADKVMDGLDGAVAKGQALTQLVQQTLDEASERVKDAAAAGADAFREAKSAVS